MRGRGFTLIEFALVLLAAGVMALVVWRIAALMGPAGSPLGAAEQSLVAARQALEGHALRTGTLPCPASDADGEADCSAGAGADRLPWKTLGLEPSSPRLRYAAQANLQPRGSPRSSLQYCALLHSTLASHSPAAGSQRALALGAAYAVAAAGADRRFSGGASAYPFELTPAGEDDRLAVAGLADHAARLGCVQRLTRQSARRRADDVAADLLRVAAGYHQFRATTTALTRQQIDTGEAALKMAQAATAIITFTEAAQGYMDQFGLKGKFKISSGKKRGTLSKTAARRKGRRMDAFLRQVDDANRPLKAGLARMWTERQELQATLRAGFRRSPRGANLRPTPQTRQARRRLGVVQRRINDREREMLDQQRRIGDFSDAFTDVITDPVSAIEKALLLVLIPRTLATEAFLGLQVELAKRGLVENTTAPDNATNHEADAAFLEQSLDQLLRVQRARQRNALDQGVLE